MSFSGCISFDYYEFALDIVLVIMRFLAVAFLFGEAGNSYLFLQITLSLVTKSPFAHYGPKNAIFALK